MKPIVPEVCDRLGCKVDTCYGWDLCRQAREKLTEDEIVKWTEGLLVQWEEMRNKDLRKVGKETTKF